MGEKLATSFGKRFSIQFLVFVLILGLLPFLIVLVAFSVCYRTAVKYAAKLFRKDLSSMVTTIGNVFAGDNGNKTPMSNVVLLTVIEGILDCKNIKEALINNALEPKVGVSRYAELKQYLAEWCGYHFWKTDRKFNLDNHFKVIDDDKFRTENDVRSLCGVSLCKNWVRQRPLWELIIIKNYIPSNSTITGPHTALIWRSHHSLADGYSLLYFLMESLGPNKVIIPRPVIFSRSFLQKLVYIIQFPWQFVWEFSKVLMSLAETYSLSTPNENRRSSEELHIDISPIISIQKVKDVKRHYGTSFAAVQFAALGGALQEYHLRRNIPVPDLYPCLTILPHLKHKLYKFSNYLGGAQTYLPTSECDPYKRLMHSNRDYDRIKQSTFPIASFYLNSLAGCNIRIAVKWILENHFYPIGITSFPGPLVHGNILGHKIIDNLGWAGPNEGRTGIMFAILSYADGFRISTISRASVMTKDDVSEITNLFVQKIEELHKLALMDEKKSNV